ncbi:MAG: hypothetical protein IV090_27155 [Candidatus Sericytochromatia bacterium]|nr:hypothetical protein [Candidatus Sericytochromatia bacterium]
MPVPSLMPTPSEPLPIRTLPPEARPTPLPDFALLSSALTVLAGSDTSGFQDGNGEQAKFNEPKGLDIDSYGNLYVADTNNHTIRKISPQGDVTTFAGTGQEGNSDGIGKNAQFRFPRYLTVDDKGQIFLIETVKKLDRIYSGGIRKINAQNEVSTIRLSLFDSLQTSFFSIFWHRKSNQFYVTSVDSVFSITGESDAKKIVGKDVFSLENSGLTGAVNSIKEIQERDRSLGRSIVERYPTSPFLSSVIVDENDNIIVSDDNSHLLWKLTPRGQIFFLAGGAHFWWDERSVDGCGHLAGFYSFGYLTQDKAGYIYASDRKIIRKITPEGCVSTIKIQGKSESQTESIIQPSDLALDQVKNILYILSENKIYKLDLNARAPS